MKELRLLRPNEIDVRVGTINEKGATLLLYKDARVDMNILDEAGVKWKRSHELINGNLFCTISIWDDEIKEWISRQDVGVESQAEKEKGQASDAFKRAGFNFGIGRELYTAPFTWISASNYEGFINGKTQQGKDRWATYDKFAVKTISYDENKEINGLEIINTKTKKVVFSLGGNLAPKQVQDRSKAHEAMPEPIGEDAALTRAKKAINEQMIQQGYDRSDSKRAFIKTVLGKESIDTLNEADQIADALDNEK